MIGFSSPAKLMPHKILVKQRHEQNRNSAFAHHSFRYAAQKGIFQGTLAMGAHDNHIGMELVGHLENHGGGMPMFHHDAAQPLQTLGLFGLLFPGKFLQSYLDEAARFLLVLLLEPVEASRSHDGGNIAADRGIHLGDYVQQLKLCIAQAGHHHRVLKGKNGIRRKVGGNQDVAVILQHGNLLETAKKG